jgi:hypothetical protein
VSAHAALVFAIGLTGLCVLCTACFMVWLLWSLFWTAYDHVMQRHLRVKNSELDVSYRTGQFYIPPSMRDIK